MSSAVEELLLDVWGRREDDVQREDGLAQETGGSFQLGIVLGLT